MTTTLRRRWRDATDLAGPMAFLAARAVAGVEHIASDHYRRAVRVGSGDALVAVRRGEGGAQVSVRVGQCAAVDEAFAIVGRVFGRDQDLAPAYAQLARDPVLGALVARFPGQSIPGAAAGDELVVRAIVGQQVSVVAARTLLGRIVRQLGPPLSVANGTVTHLFPDAARLADAPDGCLPLPGARRDALRTVCRHLADGTLDLRPGADAAHIRVALNQLPGIGPWTTEYVLMRAVRDPDAFPSGDLVLRTAFAALTGRSASARQLAAVAEGWRPWRALAAQLLWRSAAAASGWGRTQ